MGRRNSCLALVLLVVLVFQCFWVERVWCVTVTYDHKALVIDGKRRVLQSGSIHYPRTTPEVWPEIIRKSKEGGLDVIETYVFWNYHEPVRGQCLFSSNCVPVDCFEIWDNWGFPLWLHFIPGVQFRTSNDIFKNAMKSFLTKIVDLMKDDNLFASQGGPIILAQVYSEQLIATSDYNMLFICSCSCVYHFIADKHMQWILL
ncbi:hypothetical protein NC651_026428 [Populus alba x Populus x berolinensis]|nr:hypothetical protein NC651_026428 [Populus alba x Populus x berolinensis]